MKKLLGILATIGLTSASSGATLINFSPEEKQIQTEPKENEDRVDPQGADITFELKETKIDELLKETDQQELQKTILKELTNNNANANVEEDIFEFDLTSITANDQTIWVKVIATLPKDEKPGLISKPVAVNLTFNPKLQDQIAPQEAEVTFNLNETKKGETLKENDKTLLYDVIITVLNKANRNAVVNEQTFEFSLEETTPEIDSLAVKVNATDSTADKPGLIATEKITVTLHLTPAALERNNAHPATVTLELTKTHKEENLKIEDQTLLSDNILNNLKSTNQEFNLEDDTFVIGDLSTLTPESIDVIIQVNPTFSTPDKQGLNLGDVKVELNLVPIKYEQKPARPTTVVVNLEKTYNEGKLQEDDPERVHDAIIEQLTIANHDAHVEKDTFNVDTSQLTTQQKEIEVEVKPTEGTEDKPGLTDDPVIVPLDLTLATKIPLEDVIEQATIPGVEEMNEEMVKQAILEANPNSEVQLTDFEIQDFEKPDYDHEGKATMEAQQNSHFSGSVPIKISKIGKIELSKVVTEVQIQGDDLFTEAKFLAEVLRVNPNSGVKESDVEVEDFNVAWVNKDGSGILRAKDESEKFTGQVKITIQGLDQIDLTKVLINKTTDGNLGNIADTAFMQVRSVNAPAGYQIRSSEVRIENFTPATKTENGHFKVIGLNNECTGEVEFTITPYNKINLNDLIRKVEVDGNEVNTQEAVLKKVLELNSEAQIDESQIEIPPNGFQPAGVGQQGYCQIQGKINSEKYHYQYKVLIIITALTN